MRLTEVSYDMEIRSAKLRLLALYSISDDDIRCSPEVVYRAYSNALDSGYLKPEDVDNLVEQAQDYLLYCYQNVHGIPELQ